MDDYVENVISFIPLQTIQAVQPDVVMVELCNGRISILQLDEEKLLEEAKNISMDKMILSIKQVRVKTVSHTTNLRLFQTEKVCRQKI